MDRKSQPQIFSCIFKFAICLFSNLKNITKYGNMFWTAGSLLVVIQRTKWCTFLFQKLRLNYSDSSDT